MSNKIEIPKQHPIYWLLYPVVSVMGCPCCGPEWYRKLLRMADDIAGNPYSPEYDK